jgi:hypothetical protein
MRLPLPPPIHPFGGGTTASDSLSLSEETKIKLRKIGAEYTLQDGKARSLEDVIILLIEQHQQALSK